MLQYNLHILLEQSPFFLEYAPTILLGLTSCYIWRYSNNFDFYSISMVRIILISYISSWTSELADICMIVNEDNVLP